MPQQPQVGPEISVNGLRGVNLRRERSQLESGECDRIFGLWPQHTGSLSRIPGKQLWRNFEDAEGEPYEVLSLCEAFLGQSYVVVQFGDNIGLYTVDELRNRVEPYSLTPTPASGVGDYALLLHSESNGTVGGALGSTDNNFYKRTLNTLATDENGVLSGLSNSTFTLPLGTYQIDAVIGFGQNPSNANGPQCRAGLYSVTNGAFKTQIDTGFEIISTSGVVAAMNTANLQGTYFVYLMGRFQVVSATETFAIYQAVNNLPTVTLSNQTSAQGWPASRITSKNEIYATINLVRE